MTEKHKHPSPHKKHETKHETQAEVHNKPKLPASEAEKDLYFQVAEFDSNTTLESFPVKRTGKSEPEYGWLLLGKGVDPKDGKEVGKFIKHEKIETEGEIRYQTIMKYLPLEAQIKLKAHEQERRLREDAETIEQLSEEAIIATAELSNDDDLRLMAEEAKLDDDTETQPVAQRDEWQSQLVASSESVLGMEKSKDKYPFLRTLLPPVTRPEEVMPEGGGAYDHLFVKDDSVYQAEMARRAAEEQTPEGRKRAYYDRFVTEENRLDAMEVVAMACRADHELSDIFFDANLSRMDIATVDAIREDPELRYKIAEHLYEKLEGMISQQPNQFGARVTDNSPSNLKNDPLTGQRMTSRVYTVSMALKMLGGEFKKSHEANDLQFDESGRPIVGQHRHAARTLLLGF